MSGLQRFRPMNFRYYNHRESPSQSGFDSHVRILKDHTLVRTSVDATGCYQENLRIRLTMANVLRRNRYCRNRDAGPSHQADTSIFSRMG
jgi:hypothetical protein